MRDLGHLFFPLWVEAAPQSPSAMWLIAVAATWGLAATICMAGMYRNLPTWGCAHDHDD